jgi:DNA-binding PadR family transcriptional regulator
VLQAAASSTVHLLLPLVLMEEPQLSLTDYAVLGLLAEGPTHGFAISKELGPEGPVGRILTVRRPLTYRALDRLVDIGFAEPLHREPGDAGPQRVIHRINPTGRRALNRWLKQPVGHIRDLRIEFQLKLALLRRSGKSPLDLIRAQRNALQPTLAALDSPVEDIPDHVELWRQHNATAAAAYLDHLQAIYGAG